MFNSRKRGYLFYFILSSVVITSIACNLLNLLSESKKRSDFETSPIKPVSAGETIVINSDGAQLTIPATAIEADNNSTLQTIYPDSDLAAILQDNFQINTNLHQVTVDGENDGIGTATINVPDKKGQNYLLEIIDGEFFSLTELEAKNGKVNFNVPIVTAPKDEGDDSLQFDGSYHFAIIQTTTKLNLEPLQNKHMAKSMAQPPQTNSLNCGSLSQSITEVDFCRQNSVGTINVLYNRVRTPNMTNDKADQIVSVMERILNAYASKNFSAAQLDKSKGRIHVVINSGAGDPYYSPSNSTIYLPEDSALNIDSSLSWELAHELAHWVQDHSYNFTRAYWGNKLGTSPYRTWWLEVSAENMVFLFDPAYIEKNLTFYGMTTHSTKNTPFQYSPNLWNDQLYNHAQLVKVFMCENSAICPISESGFVQAINQGTFPYQDETVVNKVSENLNEYARYLLGKSPESANSQIPILPAATNGAGYGEFIEPSFRDGVGELKKTGYDPQMVTTGDKGSQIANVSAEIQPGGVYPLVIQSGINPEAVKIPLEVTALPGAPFYYRIGEGDIQYSDGSKKMILGIVHPVWGVQKIRIVAVASEPGVTFEAEIRNADLSGTWKMNTDDDTIVYNITCEKQSKEWEVEYAAKIMFPLVLSMGDFSIANSFTELNWEPNSTRWESYVSNKDETVSSLDILSSQGVALIAPGEILLNVEYDEKESPPYKFAAGDVDAVLWDQIVGNFILKSTYKNMEYRFPQDGGSGSWKLSDGNTKVELNVTVVVMQFGPDGELQFPKNSVGCSGTVTFDSEIIVIPAP
ncbi:MAG: hypothetical protein CVU43_11275 [Chloroflexi bacterium HGW-Chloroflexi-5]|jgi:hypothetical protein|nr:MAG: hypothetical protein CVU43_11275 [Chloroflexi bacterium HGW-Chloroflexi-5]